MRKFYFTVNADTGYVIDSTGIPISKTFNLPKLTFGSSCIFCITFVNSALQPFEFGAEDNFNLAVKDTFNHMLSPMAFSDAEQFNISGDWSATDPTIGKISVRVSCQLPAFHESFAYNNEPEKMANVEIHWFSGSDGSDTIVMEHQLPCKNAVYAQESLPVGSSSAYRTATAQDAIDNAIKHAIRFDNDTQRSAGFNLIDTETKSKEFVVDVNIDGSFHITEE